MTGPRYCKWWCNLQSQAAGAKKLVLRLLEVKAYTFSLHSNKNNDLENQRCKLKQRPKRTSTMCLARLMQPKLRVRRRLRHGRPGAMPSPPPRGCRIDAHILRFVSSRQGIPHWLLRLQGRFPWCWSEGHVNHWIIQVCGSPKMWRFPLITMNLTSIQVHKPSILGWKSYPDWVKAVFQIGRLWRFNLGWWECFKMVTAIQFSLEVDALMSPSPRSLASYEDLMV